jgi:hypothetical protein
LVAEHSVRQVTLWWLVIAVGGSLVILLPNLAFRDGTVVPAPATAETTAVVFGVFYLILLIALYELYRRHGISKPVRLTVVSVAWLICGVGIAPWMVGGAAQDWDPATATYGSLNGGASANFLRIWLVVALVCVLRSTYAKSTTERLLWLAAPVVVPVALFLALILVVGALVVYFFAASAGTAARMTFVDSYAPGTYDNPIRVRVVEDKPSSWP